MCRAAPAAAPRARAAHPSARCVDRRVDTPQRVAGRRARAQRLHRHLHADHPCRSAVPGNMAQYAAHLGIPVHVLAGKDDELVSEADALAWQVFTSTQFSITRFDGGHFHSIGNAGRTGSPGHDRPAVAAALSRQPGFARTRHVRPQSRQRHEVTHFENWQIRKPVVSASGGIVVSQHYKASRIGAAVLEEGGNAIDAAIAASFAIGVLEPWQSGGRRGAYGRRAGRRNRIQHRLRGEGPVGARLDDYRLTGESARGMFGWPAVVDDRNLEGPFSIGVPGQVAGMTLAHREFGSLPWRRLVEPAVRCAREAEVDWYLTFKVASAARRVIRRARHAICPVGTCPRRTGPAPPAHHARASGRHAGGACRTGRRGFYRGALARRIAADFAAVGSRLCIDDLAAYGAEIKQIEALCYRDATILTSSELTAGPALACALSLFARQPAGDDMAVPDARFFSRIADALAQTYAERIGAGAPRTTHDAVRARRISVSSTDMATRSR